MIKKRRWFILFPLILGCLFFTAAMAGWICPYPQCWLDRLLSAVHLKTSDSGPPDFVGDSAMLSKEPQDLVPYEPVVCEVHGVEMRIEIVPIEYGTPSSMFYDKDGKRILAPGEIDPDLRKSLFPHSAHWTWGGCCEHSWKTARIRVCTKCEEAEQKWRNEHPSDK